jgi:predicted ATP-binding protein involved in virulence
MVSRRKYMKNKQNRSKKQHHQVCCETTFHGLQEWYKKKFEKLGWMILAKEKGQNDKIMEYIQSVNRLEKAIENKLKHTKDSDKKDDLNIMLHDVMILKQHLHEDFP